MNECRLDYENFDQLIFSIRRKKMYPDART